MYATVCNLRNLAGKSVGTAEVNEYKVIFPREQIKCEMPNKQFGDNVWTLQPAQLPQGPLSAITSRRK
jgi:hypothetical protein